MKNSDVVQSNAAESSALLAPLLLTLKPPQLAQLGKYLTEQEKRLQQVLARNTAATSAAYSALSDVQQLIGSLASTAGQSVRAARTAKSSTFARRVKAVTRESK